MYTAEETEQERRRIQEGLEAELSSHPEDLPSFLDATMVRLAEAYRKEGIYHMDQPTCRTLEYCNDAEGLGYAITFDPSKGTLLEVECWDEHPEEELAPAEDGSMQEPEEQIYFY